MSLSNEFYDGGDIPENFMADPEFRKFVMKVSTERLVKMLEVKKMQFEEALEDEEPNTETYLSYIGYIDAVDDLILDLNK